MEGHSESEALDETDREVAAYKAQSTKTQNQQKYSREEADAGRYLD